MDLYNGAARNFPSTQQIQYAGKFKDKWWDASILQFITNGDWKGKFFKKGTEIRVPIRPTVNIHDTTPGGNAEANAIRAIWTCKNDIRIQVTRMSAYPIDAVRRNGGPHRRA